MMKVSELQGAALDWAVAKCEEHDTLITYAPMQVLYEPKGKRSWYVYRPSTNWAQGGPIIEREVICVGSGMDAPTWYANKGLGNYHQFGPTPLVAAMRCYVASKLGDQIELPEELK